MSEAAAAAGRMQFYITQRPNKSPERLFLEAAHERLVEALDNNDANGGKPYHYNSELPGTHILDLCPEYQYEHPGDEAASVRIVSTASAILKTAKIETETFPKLGRPGGMIRIRDIAGAKEWLRNHSPDTIDHSL